ncbi:MAG: hypothetical protein L7S63_03555 [Flavobacteriales bacterium]|nr:hypothetical protein [Flavobacteriales bacterium]
MNESQVELTGTSTLPTQVFGKGHRNAGFLKLDHEAPVAALRALRVVHRIQS